MAAAAALLPLICALPGWSFSDTLSSRSSVEAYFAPYDGSTLLTTNLSVLQSDIFLIQTVTQAKRAFDEAQRRGLVDHSHPWANDAFIVQFCVYNLLDAAYTTPLIEAAKAGVRMQVLMDYKNLKEPYVPTYEWFRAAGLNVTASPNVTQRDLTRSQLDALHLVGTNVGGLMHMKLRYFSWLKTPSSKETTQVVVSGSLNPENTALENEDTLLVVHGDAATVGAYRHSYAAVLYGEPAENEYDASRAVNVLFSQAAQPKGAEATTQARHVLLDLVRSETELVLISVYSLRDVGDSNGTLVHELCAAVSRGIAVAVLTSKGQADGEAGFAGGDESLTALRMWKECGVPVYKCQNYAGKFTALHHKNALFGVSRRAIVWTDTANWSKASMGNGTSHAKPANAETTMIIDSTRLDDGRLARRFLSNALQLMRKYAPQQACPYMHAGKPVRDQCHGEMKWGQPDWIQPNATAVTASLVQAVERAHSGAWPTVKVTFTVACKAVAHPVSGGLTSTVPAAAERHLLADQVVNDTPPSSAEAAHAEMYYRVNGAPAAPHWHVTRMTRRRDQWSASLTMPFGAIVDAEVHLPTAVGLRAAQDGPVIIEREGVAVDSAFDWESSPPVRRSDAVLAASAIEIALDANHSAM